MKHYLIIALALVCLGSVISVVLMKRGADAGHESDAGTIADFSNRLDSAEIQVAFYRGTMLTLSNRLDDCQSTSLTFSNRLKETESTVALDTEQITNLTRRMAELESENQTLQALGQRAMDMTNQITSLNGQIAAAATNLARAEIDCALLENRLRRDVAERLVVERRFYNPAELQAQLENLRDKPGGEVSAESIYAGLDVEVTSNAVHVISPN